MNAADDRDAAMHELMAYWLAHPEASDTLDGIRRWWSSLGRFPGSVVQDALRRLVEQRAVEPHRAADGRVRYRLAPARRGAG